MTPTCVCKPQPRPFPNGTCPNCRRFVEVSSKDRTLPEPGMGRIGRICAERVIKPTTPRSAAALGEKHEPSALPSKEQGC